MISKQQAKFVKSLKLKKYRKKAALFIVEGAKNVAELLSSEYEVTQLFLTQKFMDDYSSSISKGIEYELCSEKELTDMGTFQTNEYALAVARMRLAPFDLESRKFVIALDDVSDPGNLGTIIRIADWYGVDTIFASAGTADFYNPKVINASMGSFTRVDVHYMDLESFFKENPTLSIYGAMLDGENVHDLKVENQVVLLLGNESKGINSSLIKYIDKKITIPRIGEAESLNVAVSTAIICDNLFRN